MKYMILLFCIVNRSNVLFCACIVENKQYDRLEYRIHFAKLRCEDVLE